MIAVIQDMRAQEYFSSAADFARLYVGAIEPQYQKLEWSDILSFEQVRLPFLLFFRRISIESYR